jgi:hypothetical protein
VSIGGGVPSLNSLYTAPFVADGAPAPGVGVTKKLLSMGLFTGGGISAGIDSYLADVGSLPKMVQADLTLIGCHDAVDPRAIFEGIGGRGTHDAPTACQPADIIVMFKADAYDTNGAQTVSVANIEIQCELAPGVQKVPCGFYFLTMNGAGVRGYRWVLQNSGQLIPFLDNTYPIGSGGFGNPTPKRVSSVYAMQLFAEQGDGGLQILNAVNGAAAQAATLANAPIAGNPTFWLKIAVNNAFKYIPCW